MAHASLGAGLDGILIVAKPAGPTSHDVVALVRRLAATKRVGHGGTLDPFASGVLPVFLGHATRVVEYHLGDRKAYRATVCFGASSTTDDLEGELTPADGHAPTREVVEAALPGLTGPISQRPPAYSAVKVAGRRAYAMARAGETVLLAERSVTIHAIDLVSWDETDPDRPIAVVDVSCSAGTYIRALARDLGESLGSAAYLGALTRTASGPFTLEGASSLEFDPDGRRRRSVGSPAAAATDRRRARCLAGRDADDRRGRGGRAWPVHPTVRRPARAGRPLPAARRVGSPRRDRHRDRRSARARQGLRGPDGQPVVALGAGRPGRLTT